MTRLAADGALRGDDEFLSRLASEGIRSVADVLARAETVRVLRNRSNHVLRAGGAVVHVKRRRGRRPSPEAAAIRAADEAGAPVARLAFEGVDRIVACGDHSGAGVLDRLAQVAPVIATVNPGADGDGGIEVIIRHLVEPARETAKVIGHDDDDGE